MSVQGDLGCNRQLRKVQKPRERASAPEPIPSHFALSGKNHLRPALPAHITMLFRPSPRAWAKGKAGASYGTAAEDTLVGQAGREQLMGTEHLSVLVHGPVVLAGLWGGPEPRGCVRFCGWRGTGGRRKMRFHVDVRTLPELIGPLF